MKNFQQPFNQNDSKIKDTVKDHLADYLIDEGINIHHNFRCLNPNHDDKNPSMTYYADDQRVFCHGCKASFDIYDLYAIQHLDAPVDDDNHAHYDFKEAFNGLAELLSIPVKKLNIKPEDAAYSKINDYNGQLVAVAQQHIDDKDAIAYLNKRGISLALAKEFKLGYIAKWVNPTVTIKENKEPKPTPRLIIPSTYNSYLARDARSEVPEAEQAYTKINQGGKHLYHAQPLKDGTKTIFIVEGELDCLSVIQAIRATDNTDKADAVGLCSTSQVVKFKKQVIECKQDAEEHDQPYNPIFIIATDNDNAGNRAAGYLIHALRGMKLQAYRTNIAGNQNDPNAALTDHQSDFYSKVDQTIQDPEDYLNSLFDRIAYYKNHPQYTPTGFKRLDHLLDGGLYPQLYVIGAISSLGKTTFTLQIADRIALKQQKPVFIYSLEAGKDELTEKILSRWTYILADENKGNPQTARHINNGQWLDNVDDKELVMKARHSFAAYYSLLHIKDCTVNRPSAKEIAAQIHTYCQIHPDKKPIVIVDYLQILKAEDDKDTDKEKVTKSIAALKGIATQDNVSVITISSFNRANYQNLASMESFKESGEIEYYADALIGLQYQAVHPIKNNLKGKTSSNANDELAERLETAKKEIPRRIELTILKNRNGRSSVLSLIHI